MPLQAKGGGVPDSRTYVKDGEEVTHAKIPLVNKEAACIHKPVVDVYPSDITSLSLYELTFGWGVGTFRR